MTKVIRGLALTAMVALQFAPTVPFAETAPAALRAGAARIDITPELADLPAPFTRVQSHIYARVVVLESQGKRAVIVVADVPTIASKVYKDLVAQIAQKAGAPVENVMLAVTHTHNAVRLDTNPVGISIPGSAKITADTVAAMLKGVEEAVVNLQPAKAGYASGVTNILADRGETRKHFIDPAGAEPVDRRIGVFKVETMSGEPIAFVVNANIEPIISLSRPDEVNADLSGAMERYIEGRYGDKPVVLYTVGTSTSMPYDPRPRPPLPSADPEALIAAVGTILGEEALETSGHIQTSEKITLSGAMDTLICPGKETTPLNLPNKCSDAPGSNLPKCVFTDKDTDPVKLQIGVLKVGDLSFVQADSNITPKVWERLKAEAPANTNLVSQFYGPLHYVVADADYPSNSYRVTATTAKKGCAADGFVNTATSLLKKAEAASN